MRQLSACMPATATIAHIYALPQCNVLAEAAAWAQRKLTCTVNKHETGSCQAATLGPNRSAQGRSSVTCRKPTLRDVATKLSWQPGPGPCHI